MRQTVKLREWIFPVILILFILQVILLPVMIGLTYATRSEQPEHILTYTTGQLVWDKNTFVRADGSANLSFFETLYQNVNAENAEKILAPGTQKDSVIRLKNNTKRSVGYTAVLYRICDNNSLKINASLSGSGFIDASGIAWPQQIEENAVVRAVSGTISANAMQDFDINWFWDFEDKINAEVRDRIDTYLGNKAADANADDATLGFYLVVHDGGDFAPSRDTGDSALLGGYAVLITISGSMTLILAIARKKRGPDED